MSETPQTDALIEAHHEVTYGGTAGYKELVEQARGLEGSYNYARRTLAEALGLPPDRPLEFYAAEAAKRIKA